MNKAFWFATLVYLVGSATSALAAIQYTPEGAQVSLEVAIQQVVAGGKADYTAFQDQLFIRFQPEGAPATWAVTKSLDDVSNLIKKYEKPKVIAAGKGSYVLGFQRLESPDGLKIFDIVDQLKSAMDAAKQTPAPEKEDDIADSLQDFYGANYSVTSIFGDVVTYQDISGGMGGGAAHDWEVNSLVSNKWGSPVSILSYVDNTSLLNALKQDPYIAKIAGKSGKLAELARITQLTDFARFAQDLFENAEEQPVGWSFEPMEQFNHFAIYDYDARTQTVWLRIGLEAQYGYSRGEMQQLGLKVKASAEGAPLFAAAKAGRGILWVDAKKVLK